MLRLVPTQCVAIAFVLCGNSALAATLEGRVVRIKDGDTVVVLDWSNRQHEVRLAGIDAPEKKQPFGTSARQQLAALVFKESVVVEWEKRDRYKRIVGKVLLESPKPVCVSADCQQIQDAGLALITVGLAWHYKQYEREQSAMDRELYAQAEDAAKTTGLGLWKDPNPVPPWEWRKLKQ